MKNLLSIACVAMLFAQTVKAQEVVETENQNPSVIATPTYFAKFNGMENEFKMRVLLSKRDGDKSMLRLTLRDKNGIALYTRYLDKSESQAKVDLNLEELADGQYFFEISNKYGKNQKTYLKETVKPILSNVRQLIALN